MEETDQIFQCPFCRVRLFVQETPFPCYRLAPSSGFQQKELFYVPYWRFRGLVFAVDSSGLRHHFLDTSMAAVSIPDLPPSLGLKPQALRLEFCAPQSPHPYLPPSLSRKAFLKKLAQGVRGRLGGNSIFCQAFIGETLSLIYAPHYREKGKVFDAITGDPVGKEPEGLNSAGTDSPPAAASFRPLLCPQCGWDLTGERDAVVFSCLHCGRLWEAGTSGYRSVETHQLAGSAWTESFWVPFWVIGVHCEGVPPENFEALRPFPSGSKNRKGKSSEKTFTFWVPAFKLAPRHFIRIAGIVTRKQPDSQPVEPGWKTSFHPANLPAVEAFQATPVILGSLFSKRRSFQEHLKKIRLAFRHKRLVFVPVRRLGPDWIQEDLSWSLSPSSLKHGTRL